MFIILSIRHSSADGLMKLVGYRERFTLAHMLLGPGLLLEKMSVTSLEHSYFSGSGDAEALFKR